MDKLEAIKILINVANIAQKNGIFSFEDSAIVFQAIKSLEIEENVNEIQPE